MFPNVGYPSVVDDADADSEDVDSRGGEFHGVRKCRCMAWRVDEGGGVELRCSKMLMELSVEQKECFKMRAHRRGHTYFVFAHLRLKEIASWKIDHNEAICSGFTGFLYGLVFPVFQ